MLAVPVSPGAGTVKTVPQFGAVDKLAVPVSPGAGTVKTVPL